MNQCSSSLPTGRQVSVLFLLPRKVQKLFYLILLCMNNMKTSGAIIQINWAFPETKRL